MLHVCGRIDPVMYAAMYVPSFLRLLHCAVYGVFIIYVCNIWVTAYVCCTGIEHIRILAITVDYLYKYDTCAFPSHQGRWFALRL